MGHPRSTPVACSSRDARLHRPDECTSEVQRVVLGSGLLRAAGLARAGRGHG